MRELTFNEVEVVSGGHNTYNYNERSQWMIIGTIFGGAMGSRLGPVGAVGGGYAGNLLAENLYDNWDYYGDVVEDSWNAVSDWLASDPWSYW